MSERPPWDVVSDRQVRAGIRRDLDPFTLRVLTAVSHGLRAQEAAVVLGVTPEVVYSALRRARRALAAKNTAHSIARALRHGLIS